MLINHEPQAVFRFFEQLSAIPRGSGNEAAVSSFVVNWAKSKNLSVNRDTYNNVLIQKPGSANKESNPPILLQAHLDMVCEKIPESKHDFLKDPIHLIEREDGYIVADGTTLGADNGIGVAIIMSILEDDNAVHPPIEALFTTGEEIGMVGARHISESGWIFHSKTIFNLDIGWEGVFVTGAAGGGNVTYRVSLEREHNALPCWRIEVEGLLGGHSGAEIHLGRANANQLLCRILNSISVPYSLSQWGGGGETNAIAREAYAVVSCNNEAELHREISELETMFVHEYEGVENNISISLIPIENADTILTTVSKKKLLHFLQLLPVGVLFRDDEYDLVVTSSNMASCEIYQDVAIVRTSVRSSLPSHLTHWVLPQLRTLSDLFNIDMEESDFYPGWEFQRKSPIRELALKAYEEVNGKPASFRSLHGGLECGVLMEQIDLKDAIAYGPESHFPHSPREELNIASVKATTDMLRYVLEYL